MNINDEPISKREKKLLNEITLKIDHFPWCAYGKTRPNTPVDECLCDCYDLAVLRYGQLMERYKHIGYK